MMAIGTALNGAVALLIATPVVGYLLGPIRKNGGYNSWIDLGDLTQFASRPDAARELRKPGQCSLGWGYQ